MYRDARTYYSANVLVGNWLEETRLETDRKELYRESRKQDENILAKITELNVMDELMRPVDLNTDGEYLRYGQDVQLVNRITSEVDLPGPSVASGRGGGVFLSCGIHSAQLSTGLGPGSPVTASPFTEPCVRNCFRIRGLNGGCEDGEVLKFGDVFAITPCHSSKPLFVTAAVPRLHSERGMSGHPTLKLTEALDEQCRWTAIYVNAELRLKAQGLEIPNRLGVILKQTSTGRNVAVETDFGLSTFFGDEYEVSANSYTDVRGCNKNIWEFVMSSGRPEEPVLDNGGEGTTEE